MTKGARRHLHATISH